MSGLTCYNRIGKKATCSHVVYFLGWALAPGLFYWEGKTSMNDKTKWDITVFAQLNGEIETDSSPNEYCSDQADTITPEKEVRKE